MILNSFLLAISSSVDSLGIGITYGLKKTKISYVANIILFSISIIITTFSMWFGNCISNFLSSNITNVIGSLIIIFMGFFMTFQALKKNNVDNCNSENLSFNENINDEKISKSKGNGITALEMLEKYNTDSLRFHIINNGPEKKDTNFTIEEFERTHNNEILNKFGNLVNRTLRFKELTQIPNGKLDEQAKIEIENTYKEVSNLIENLEFRAATQKVMDLVEYANKFYDENKPWIQKKEDIESFNNTIYTCAVIIANLSNLFEPFMPKSCKKIREYLKIQNPQWSFTTIEDGIKLENIEPLFNRI